MFPWSCRRCVALPVGVGVLLWTAAASGAGVEVSPKADRVTVSVDGELVTELRFADGPKPYWYPLLAPGGVAVTRHYPMRRDVADEEKDHPHHRSLWFSHGDVNGADFWAEGEGRGRIVQERILEAQGGAESGVVRTANRWETAQGEVLLTDETAMRVHRRAGERVLDYRITLKAGAKAGVFGDTKEGTMAVRLAESMRLKPNAHHAKDPVGTILQSTGIRDGATWGKRAAWTAYSGPVEGKPMTVAIFDHPANPRYPTWWHVRDYGLFAANPFGVHDFERKPAGTGNLELKAGESVTFRYRFLIRPGAAESAALEKLGAEFARSEP